MIKLVKKRQPSLPIILDYKPLSKPIYNSTNKFKRNENAFNISSFPTINASKIPLFN